MNHHHTKPKVYSWCLATILLYIPFSGVDAFPNPVALSSGPVDNVLFEFEPASAGAGMASFEQASGGPTLYLNRSEINEIKSKIQKNQQPWASAHRELMRAAENALRMSPRSVVDNGGPAAANFDRHSYGEDKTYDGDGIIRRQSNKEDSKAFYAMSGAIQDLGLAYAFTGDDRFAQKAIDLLYHWCVDPSSFMRPIAQNFSPHTPGGAAHGAITIYAAVPWMAFGTSFVLGHPYWSSKGSGAEAKVMQWMADMNRSAIDRGEESNNNFYTRYIETRAALAALLGDRGGLNEVFDLWKSHIRFSIKANGRLHRESGRTKGIDYSTYGLEPFAKVAVLARNHGVDLWNWEDGQGGSPLRRAYDFLVPYALDPHMPRKWIADGFKQIVGVNTETLGQVFQMAYAVYGDEDYAQVVRKVNRGHRIALLFGSIGDLLVGDGGYEDDWSSDDDDVDGGIPDDDEFEDDWSSDGDGPGGDIHDDSGDEQSGGSVDDEENPDVDPDPTEEFPKGEIYLNALADAHVRDGAYAHQNAGNLKGLTVKKSTTDFTREVFLKFDLSSIPATTTRAYLELHPISVGSPGQIHELALVQDDSWEEGSLVWDNKPSSSTVLGSWTPVEGQPVTVDVTEAVREAQSSDRILSLHVYSLQGGDGASWVHYGSRERSSDRPMLFITTDGTSKDDDEIAEDTEASDGATGESTVRLTSTTDSFVRGGIHADKNFDFAGGLQVAASDPDYTREAYLKFDLASINPQIQQATLRLHPILVGNADQVHVAALVPDNSWKGDALTWNNKPSSTNVLGSWTPLQGQIVTVDVTEAVRSALTGDKQLSLRIYASEPGNLYEGAYYGSNDRRDYNPVLEIVIGHSSGATTTTDSDSHASSGAGDKEATPKQFSLDQNYPNPFNPSTTIQYRLPEAATVRLAIYNVTGQLVKTLVSGTQEAGQYQVEWDGRDQAGQSVASGLYLYRIEAGSFREHRTMMMIK